MASVIASASTSCWTTPCSAFRSLRSADLLQQPSEHLGRLVAVVVPERELIDVALKVLLRHRSMCALDAALQVQTLCFESVAAPERYKPAIHQELAKRREDCVSHWPAVQARLQAENMARANRQIDLAPAALGLQMMQPPYMIPPNQPPRQVQCTSRQVGPTVQTQCF